jgi:hypothetical protein
LLGFKTTEGKTKENKIISKIEPRVQRTGAWKPKELLAS